MPLTLDQPATPRARGPAEAIAAEAGKQGDPDRHDQAEQPEVVRERPGVARRAASFRRTRSAYAARNEPSSTPPSATSRRRTHSRGACRALPHLAQQLVKEPLVGVGHRLPGVMGADAVPRPLAGLLHERRILEQALAEPLEGWRRRRRPRSGTRRRRWSRGSPGVSLTTTQRPNAIASRSAGWVPPTSEVSTKQ